ncbi:hypothetical protein RvY_07759 [Ramazzottius varieornatus]|uniref:Alpha-mannosidase n=1 Tax=Ramazzottius varieornatus TaxID=947166 RepID=A0A1D1V6B1_RAMVA|nr:hypothetical protein RvY_07759 [Ramazzottius varieornatus]
MAVLLRHLSFGRKWLPFAAIFLLMFASVAYMHFNAMHSYNKIYADPQRLNDGSEPSLRKLRKDIAVNQARSARAKVRGDEPFADDKENWNSVFDLVKYGKKLVSDKDHCNVPKSNPNKATFDVSEMVYSLKNEDLTWDGDAGVWDPEVEKQFQAGQKETNGTKAAKKLKVFLVPFSHADPGWLMTVDQYLQTYTKNTLDLVLERLQKWPEMKFIWAEISFFELWWTQLDEESRKKMKTLVQKGQVEFVNGGYVMPDEASAHTYAILHQYVYGHQWLLQNFNVTPRHGFSIDPFGYSSTMPYILKNLGFQTMFIQRIHYILRKQLVLAKAAQFRWQQSWDTSDSDSMFCYVSHTHLYDVKHTCGMDPSVCIQFDYQYGGIIQNTSVHVPAMMLLEQFRKVAHVFPHSAVLFPMGMDFRWSSTAEWDSKHGNFKLMLDYLNSKPENNVEIQFGTFDDYYKEVFEQMGTPDKWKLPRVTGDFFPYADRTVEYWTGYFTSHPFQKQLSRDLEHHLRLAEILYVLVGLRQYEIDNAPLLKTLEEATKSLGLFQHHDAITGTSKQAVSDDYEARLYKGLTGVYDVLQYLTTVLSWPQNTDRETFVVNLQRSTSRMLPKSKLIKVTQHKQGVQVVVINGLASVRDAFVEIIVDTEHVVIQDASGQTVPYQTSIASDAEHFQGELLQGGSRVTFFVKFKSLGMLFFKIRAVDAAEAKAGKQHLTKVTEKSHLGSLKYDEPIILQNEQYTVTFSPSTGLMESVRDADGNLHPIRLELKRYSGGGSRSGAYLFWPDVISDIVKYPHYIRVLKGQLFCEIHVIVPGLMRHVVRLFNSSSSTLDQFIQIENTHDFSSETNIEAVMRFTTDIRNNMTFFTDSNGFQVVRRKVSHDLPMQANYFPASTMAFLQDGEKRMTMHLARGHGVGSQDLGQIEVMMDRYLNQDDARGVEEPLREVRVTKTIVRLQLETKGYCGTCISAERPVHPSRLANRINLELNSPAMVLSTPLLANDSKPAQKQLSSSMEPLPCDWTLLMLKPVRYANASRDVGVMFHRVGTDCSGGSGLDDCRDASSGVKLADFLMVKRGLGSYNVTTINFVDVLSKETADTEITVESSKIKGLVFRA